MRAVVTVAGRAAGASAITHSSLARSAWMATHQVAEREAAQLTPAAERQQPWELVLERPQRAPAGAIEKAHW